MFQKLRGLSKDLAIYGVGDVAVSIAGFVLLPIYVRDLTPGRTGFAGPAARSLRAGASAARLPAPEDRSRP